VAAEEEAEEEEAAAIDDSSAAPFEVVNDSTSTPFTATDADGLPEFEEFESFFSKNASLFLRMSSTERDSFTG